MGSQFLGQDVYGAEVNSRYDTGLVCVEAIYLQPKESSR